MLKTLRSMPNCKMITKRAINKINKKIGIHKKLYQPIFKTYTNFEDSLRTKNISYLYSYEMQKQKKADL